MDNKCGRPNSLGMAKQDLDEILDTLDQHSTAGAGSAKRKHHRVEYRAQPVVVTVFQPGGSESRFQAACRNLSKGGISVLHSCFVHEGAKCRVDIRNLNGSIVTIKGRISRCRHVVRHVHEIGVQFDQPVDVREFIKLDPLRQMYCAETVSPDQLKGRVLGITNSELDREFIQSLLRETGLNTHWVELEHASESMGQSSFDVVLFDLDSAESSEEGADLIAGLTMINPSIPLVVMSADNTSETLERIRRCGAKAFLDKPLEGTMLFRALSEYLLQHQSGKKNGQNSKSGAIDQDMTERFQDELMSSVQAMKTSLEKGERDKLRRLAVRVKGLAPALGFDAIGVAAEDFLKALNSSDSLTESRGAAMGLIAACERASNRNAA